MTTILTTLDLPHGWARWYIVRGEAEAIAIANGRKSYLYRSTVIKAMYLILPEERE